MDVEELIKTGDKLRHMRKYDEALNNYNTALETLETCSNSLENEQKALALMGKGLIFKGLKKNKEALEVLNLAIKADPKSTKAWSNKGYILRNLKRYNDALDAFETSLDIHSKLPDNYDRISYSWDGKKLILHGLKSNNSVSYSWNGKGLVLRDLKRYDDALDAFDTSINIDPDNAFSWNGKGLVLLNLQKYTYAIEAYKTAFSKNESKRKPDIKELTFSLNGKGVAFASLGQFDKSIEAFNESIKLDSKSAFALSGKATVYCRIGKLEEALNFFEDSLKFNPNSSFAWNGKGLVLLSLKQFDTAIDSFQKSILHADDFITAYNNLAELYLDIGDLKNASLILNDFFFKDPKDYFIPFLTGRIELEKQKYDSAIFYFKKAISLSTDSSLILTWEAYAKYLKAEVSFDPNDKMYQDLIISCIRDLEKISAQIENLKKTNTHISLNGKTECLNLKRYENIRKKLLMSTQSFLVKRKCNSNISIKLLAKVTSELLRYNTLRIESYNSYFLGCFYYKLKDYFSAKDELTNCIKLNFGPKVTNSAEQLLEDIWNHKINTSIPKWWLESPYHSFRKKIIFLFLLFSIFGLLLPESSFLFLLILYNYTKKILMVFQPIHELLNSILLIIFSLFFTALSFIDWKDNTTQCAFLFMLLFFFLISPCLKSLKGSEIEIELQSPQIFELTPGLIERSLKDFEKGLNK
jgi:Tetratricopeptide repeat.